MATEKKIEDFGEKIGGARKDLAEFRKSGGFSVDQITDWTDVERSKYIVKKEVFPVPDYQKMVAEEGYSREAAYFIKKVRDSIPAQPFLGYVTGRTLNEETVKQNIIETQNEYIEALKGIQEHLMQVKTTSDIGNFQSELVKAIRNGDITIRNSFESSALRKTVRAAGSSMYKLRREIETKAFLYSEDEEKLRFMDIMKYTGDNLSVDTYGQNGEQRLALRIGGGTWYFYHEDERFKQMENWKPDTYFVRVKEKSFQSIVEHNFPTREAAVAFALEYVDKAREKQAEKEGEEIKRKGRLTPPQLKYIERSGEDFRDGLDVTGKDMLKTFSFRGGEFGNWENQNDRQANLNMSFEAFKDLAKALDMSDKDVSLGGELSIAYGARGRGNALAHFEPDRNVINLTKMRGAGSTAHEWGHALDCFIAQQNGRAVHMESDVRRDSMLADVMEAIKYKKPDPETGVVEHSDFYMDARRIDTTYAKSDKGYWQSNVELFARAFATYVQDKLAPEQSDYLCGHAEMSPVKIKDRLCYTYPRGEERERINEAFDKLIEQLKERGMLHERQPEHEHKLIHQIDGQKVVEAPQQEAVQETASKPEQKPQEELTQGTQMQMTFDMTEDSSEQKVASTPLPRTVTSPAPEINSWEQLSFEDVIEQQAEVKQEAKTEPKAETPAQEIPAQQEANVAPVAEAIQEHKQSLEELLRRFKQESAVQTEQSEKTAVILQTAIEAMQNCMNSLSGIIQEEKTSEQERIALSCDLTEITKADDMFYVIDFTGHDFYEAVSRAADNDANLKALIKEKGISSLRDGEAYSTEFYMVTDDYEEDSVYLRFAVSSRDGTQSIDVEVSLSQEEMKCFSDRIEQYTEKMEQLYQPKDPKRRTAAEIEIA